MDVALMFDQGSKRGKGRWGRTTKQESLVEGAPMSMHQSIETIPPLWAFFQMSTGSDTRLLGGEVAQIEDRLDGWRTSTCHVGQKG